MPLLCQDLQIVGFLSGMSTQKAQVHQRVSHALLYKIDGESVYHMRGQDYHITPGSLLYIPEGETYSFEKISEGDSRYCLVNYHATHQQSPTLYHMSAGEDMPHLFRQMERSFRFGGQAGYYECLSGFFRLLAAAEHTTQLPYTTQLQKEQIAEAIRYLEDHLFDRDLLISDLHAICGMSATTFRTIFHSRFGTTPKRYLLQQRLLSARLLLESGEYESIAEVANRVGFDDPLYFSKCFRQQYGICPSQF